MINEPVNQRHMSDNPGTSASYDHAIPPPQVSDKNSGTNIVRAPLPTCPNRWSQPQVSLVFTPLPVVQPPFPPS